jgi:hypothetical protein
VILRRGGYGDEEGIVGIGRKIMTKNVNSVCGIESDTYN